MTERTPVVTVFLRNRGEGLLFRRSEAVGSYTGQWGAVAGHVTTDEGVTRDPETAARAEIREETGLSEETVTLVRAGDPFDVDDGDRQWRVHPFVFDGDRRNVTTNEETDEHEGCPPTEILRRETVPRLWTSYDRVRPGVETVAEDTEHGSAYLSYRALECLRDEAALRVEGQASGEVHEVAIALREARPAMAVLANRVNRAMSDAGDPTDPAAVKRAAAETLAEAFDADERAGTRTPMGCGSWRSRGGHTGNPSASAGRPCCSRPPRDGLLSPVVRLGSGGDDDGYPHRAPSDEEPRLSRHPRTHAERTTAATLRSLDPKWGV